ncbi:MAG TPA: SET domain-containing protein-lysine N-methyltransferase, partial [Paraburkholderia sp.]
MPDVAHERRKSTRRSQGAAFAMRVRKSSASDASNSSGCRTSLPVLQRIHSMSSRRIAVRRSGVHGKGVFAIEPIAAGERLIEYKG